MFSSSLRYSNKLPPSSAIALACSLGNVTATAWNEILGVSESVLLWLFGKRLGCVSTRVYLNSVIVATGEASENLPAGRPGSFFHVEKSPTASNTWIMC
jgi:hypothetical protein